MKPRLLDAYCGAGGAGYGYHLAGFDVVGVDLASQPRYPFTFIQGDAIEYIRAHGHEFDAIHASPPCTDYTTMHTTGPDRGTAWMLKATIELLAASGRPYVVENVPGAAAHMPGAYTLCGKAFGLAPLKRHRLFLTSFPILVPPCICRRGDTVVGVYGELTRKDRPANTGRSKPTIRASLETARRLMECPWMAAAELSQAIPPAYTQFIGEQLLHALAPVP